MRRGKLKIYIFVLIFFLGNIEALFGLDKIESIPLINLEELSPTFEEDKDVLENKDEQKSILQDNESFGEEKLTKKTDRNISTIIKEKLMINKKCLFIEIK